MTGPATGGNDTPIRYLDARTVAACLPSPAELVALASLALRSLVAGAQVPPKAAVAGAGVFAHAMPARLEGAAVPGGGGEADLLGMKWIAGGSANRSRGLPAMAALIVLADPVSGAPVAILEGGAITAWRTAALSGAAIRLLAPTLGGRPARVVILGAGAQGAAHLAIVGSVLPGARVTIHDRHPERAEALAAGAVDGVERIVPTADPTAALRDADILITATALGGVPDLGPDDVAPSALLLPVDYGARVTPALASTATFVAVDDRRQFERNRDDGRLSGWPDATATLGELLITPRFRPPGRALALHQGPGIADLVVADAVLRAAVRGGLGLDLPR